MALYDGFFDAELNTETGKYDREYSAPDFTGYFGAITGSGVCVYENPDSMRVRREAGSAVVEPGYLFLRGYWLKNDGEYSVALPSAGAFRILARLDLSRRMIEIVSQPVAEEVPEDSLVLSVIDVDAGTVTDTREDPELCGVIDAVGDLAQKIEAVLQYIDTEIEQKLREAQEQILAQDARLDAKIVEVAAQVEKITPPPVGTVKFTASQDVGPEWLRCDGSFVNEEDYPELVAALGKLTPGVDDYQDLLTGTSPQQISNVCLAGGMAWVYLVKDHKLVGANATTKKEIPVTGASGIVESAANEAVLSISGGSLWLVQNIDNVLEAASFAGNETSLAVTALDVKTLIGLAGFPAYCMPSITKINGLCHLAVDTTSSYTTNGITTSTNYITWQAGSFSSTAEKNNYKIERINDTPSINDNSSYILDTVIGFSRKNSNDMVMSVHAVKKKIRNDAIAQECSYYMLFGPGSISQYVYGTPHQEAATKMGENVSFENMLKDKVLSRYIMSDYAPQLNILPVAANGEVMYVLDLSARKITLTYCRYTPKTFPDWYEIPIQLPARARLYKESVCYAQGLWFIFVGTGLLFSETLENGVWGYLDTTDMAGVITKNGCADYDSASNCLYLSGVATDGQPKLVRVQLPEVYNYANDGAFLPTIASDGVPAYIKAKEVE